MRRRSEPRNHHEPRHTYASHAAHARQRRAGRAKEREERRERGGAWPCPVPGAVASYEILRTQMGAAWRGGAGRRRGGARGCCCSGLGVGCRCAGAIPVLSRLLFFCYSGVILVLFWCYSCVIPALFLRYSCVILALFLRYSCVILALFRCYSGFIPLVIPSAPPPSAWRTLGPRRMTLAEPTRPRGRPTRRLARPAASRGGVPK